MRTELLRPQDPAWPTWLREGAHDIYQTAGFHAYAEGSGEGRAFLAVLGDRHRGLAWPYLLRDVAGVPGLAGSDATDVTSVYGYPGPVAWGCDPGDRFLGLAWTELLALWRDQRVVAAFTRFHPLIENVSLVAGFRGEEGLRIGIQPVIRLGETVSIDCAIDDEAARGAYHSSERRNIERARDDGLITVEDEGWASLGEFARLYRATMALNRASPYYYFSDADLVRLRDALADHAHLLVTRRGDDMVAAGILIEYAGIVHTYLSASDRGVRPSPKPLFYDDARRWARARRNRLLHLGGGRGSTDDSLLAFKRRFSALRHAFHVGRWVLDARAYRDLVVMRKAVNGPHPSLDPAYFPAYRAERPARSAGVGAADTAAPAMNGGPMTGRDPGDRPPQRDAR